MQQATIDQIQENKFDILEEFVESESSQEDFNDRLLTRQAILHEYLKRSGRKREFQTFLVKFGMDTMYETGVHVKGKKISKERLELFGLTDIIPKMQSLGYNVS